MTENHTPWRDGYFAALTKDEDLATVRYWPSNPYEIGSPLSNEWHRGLEFGSRLKRVVDEKYAVGS